MILDLPSLFVTLALIALVIVSMIGAAFLVYLASQPAPPIGYMEGEPCNREGCQGEIYDEARADGHSCYCMVTAYPPCGFCENPHEACDTCDWRSCDEV